MWRHGGIPTVSQTSASPSPQYLVAASGVSRPCFPEGYGRAAGGEDEHVVLDKLFGEFDMQVVVLDTGVSAADDSGQTSDTAIDDVVVQRSVTGAEHTTQHVVDGLVAEADDHVLLLGGD